MHHNALWRRVWDSRRPAGGLIRPLDHLLPVLPLKPPNDSSLHPTQKRT